MLALKEKINENTQNVRLNEDYESLINKVLKKKLISANLYTSLPEFQINLLNYIIQSYKCNSFESLIKKIYYSQNSIDIKDKYYKELLFRTATNQHLEIMRVEKLLFQFISNLNMNTENFFKNFEKLFLSKKDDQLQYIIQSVKSDKQFLDSVKELDKQLSYMDYEKRAKIYDYLKKEFYYQINSTATEAVALIFSEYPLMPVLINAWKYMESIATNVFLVDLPLFYKQFLNCYTTEGDFIDTYIRLNSSTIAPKQLKNSLCFLAGTTNFKDVTRKYFILNYQSERKDSQMINLYNERCFKLYNEIIKGKSLSCYEEIHAPAIIEGYIRSVYQSKLDKNEDTTSFLKRAQKKYNLSDEFIESVSNMHKLPKEKKFEIISKYIKSMNFFMSR